MSSPAQTRSLSLDTEWLGRSQPWLIHHRGVEFTGEIIVAESPDASWGSPLTADLDFRLVFFTVPRRVPPDQIQDRRIAMAVPRRSPHQVRPTRDRELQAIHEARARYVTARDSDTLTLRRSMEEREASVREELARRFAVAFSQGRIYTHPSVRVRPRDIFEGETAESWADRLATSVLSLAYPEPLYDHDAFPHILTGAVVAAVFRGLFNGDPDAKVAVGGFGPGLGLTWPEPPGLFDASQCRAVAILQREAEARGGEMPAAEAVRLLSGDHGLTRPLALLYLLAFVRQHHAELELSSGHSVTSAQGGPFLGDRITWDMVPEVSFSESVAEHLGTLRLHPSVTWDSVLPYATLLVDGLESSREPTVVEAEERRLLEELRGIGSEIAGTAEALNALEASLGGTPKEEEAVRDRLQPLSGVSDYREFYRFAQDHFQGPSGLDEALSLHRRLVQLATLAPAASQAKVYLDSMTFRRAHSELEAERDSVSARFEMESLIANPSLWASIEDGVKRLRARYVDVYRTHHSSYHQQALELGRRLERLRPQVEAVARFDQIPELGEPVGTEVPGLFQEVVASLRECDIAELDSASLEAAPLCGECELPLHEDVPRRDPELLFGATESAMREYNRRLGSHAVRRILAHPTKEQLDRFVTLVQVADPSVLANVLDDDVVAFLRRFLTSG